MPNRQPSTSFSPLNPTISTSTSSTHTTTGPTHLSASRRSLHTAVNNSPVTHIREDSPGHRANDDGQEPALLIPTDRGLEEFIRVWVGQLGRVKFDKEVVLSGYAIYALRTWYLSRDHWSQTIVTQTGKQTEQISLYRLVADPALNQQDAEAEVARATQVLAAETKSIPRKTDQGFLLVTTPSAFGQDAFFVPGGDLREARPYLVVNTGLRRLGCGGRAAMTLETPIAALQKKFLDSYRLPTPPTQPSLTRPNSPSSSPSKPSTLSSQSPISPRPLTQHPILADPLCSMVLELVRLVQASLALWGLFEQDMIDGLFCDETKKGIFAWRRSMGMEHEESLKIEKETSGGCIDQKTLTVLLSSVTSSYYQLNHLSQEKLPKDPFTKVRRFLTAWNTYHTSSHSSSHHDQHLSIHTIRSLTSDFYHQRSRSGTDALKVHKFLFSGVASATSSISANLKGGHIDDTPLRKREYLSPIRAEPDGDTSRGLALIVPNDELSPMASPNVMTSNLEAYLNGILKTREKDWDLLGARRVGWLWSGHTAGTEPKGRNFVRVVVRRRTQSRDFGHGYHGPVEDDDDDSPPGGALGPLNGVVRRTGSVLIGGLNGLVSRKGTTYETSDSEAGPGPSSLRGLVRRKQSVPVVIEPGVDEMGEQNARASLSPSPTFSARPSASLPNRASYLSAISNTTKLPSIMTSFSANNSTLSLNRLFPSDNARRSSIPAPETRLPSDQWDGKGTTTERAVAWRDVGRETAMLRTASDGADVTVEEGGNEWEVINPHGTGRGQHEMISNEGTSALLEIKRRHSFQDREYYQGMRVTAVENLAVDVELCHTIQKLRRHERELAQRAAELADFESTLRSATRHLQTHLSSRNHSLTQLRSDAHNISDRLQDLPQTVDNDEAIQSQINVIAYETTGDTSSKELKWRLETLKEEWEIARKGNEERRRVAEGRAEVVGLERSRKGGWWIFG